MVSCSFMSAMNTKFHEPPFQGSQILRVSFFLKETFCNSNKQPREKDHSFSSCTACCVQAWSWKTPWSLFGSCALGGDTRNSNAVSDNSTNTVCSQRNRLKNIAALNCVALMCIVAEMPLLSGHLFQTQWRKKRCLCNSWGYRTLYS